VDNVRRENDVCKNINAVTAADRRRDYGNNSDGHKKAWRYQACLSNMFYLHG
jgi:hypothetical protein